MTPDPGRRNDRRFALSETVKLSFQVPHQRSTPARARDAVQRLLGDDAPLAMVRDAILLTSELVSNAVVHAPGSCTLDVEFSRDPLWLHVDVSDSSRRPPHPGTPSAEGLGGHGLQMVDKISSRWGWTNLAHGKVIWFELTESRPTG